MQACGKEGWSSGVDGLRWVRIILEQNARNVCDGTSEGEDVKVQQQVKGNKQEWRTTSLRPKGKYNSGTLLRMRYQF
jgi:hypothetical protein